MSLLSMHISQHGLQFLEGWEGIRLFKYDDGGPGKGNCTIGIGHLIHLGPCQGWASEQPFNGGITKQQAYELLKKDIVSYEEVVKRFCRVNLTQNQFDALVDFCYNTGGGYPRVWEFVNNRWDLWQILPFTATTGAGITDPVVAAQVTSALKRRRAQECELFYKEDEMTPQQMAEIKAHIDFKFQEQQNYLLFRFIALIGWMNDNMKKLVKGHG